MRVLTTLLLASSLSAGAAPMFRNPHPVAIPVQSVSALLTADFNGDHHPDVMIVDPASALAVFISNGTGPFAAPVLTPITQATGEPGIGDVNRDGRIDVVLTDWSSQTAAVLLGNGDGSFTIGTTLTTGVSPGPAAVGDFNGDTFADIVIGADNSVGGINALRVYLGNGTGSFAGAITSLNVQTTKLVVADLNRDGKSDLLANAWSSSVAVIANGDGTFTPTSSFTSGDIGVADFNHDNIPDVAIAAGGTHDNFVEVRMGLGDGTLAAATRYVAGYDAGSIAVADVDSDGNPDLLAAGTMGSTVTLLRGNANGTFRTAEYFLSGPSAWKVVAGDFDRDNTIDFVTSDYNSEIWSLSYVRGNGDGTFQTYRAFHTNETVPVSRPGLGSSGAIVADMNNDDHLDVVLSQEHPYEYPTFPPSDLLVLLGDGTGKLASPIFTATVAGNGSGVPQIAVGDVNHDGHDDVVAVSSLGYNSPVGSAYLGDGTGHFAPATPINLGASGPITLGDFDDDSNLDLLVAGGSNGVFLHRGNGDGTFATGTVTNQVLNNLLVGDLNGDGRADFVSSTAAFLNDGTGHFTGLLVSSEEIKPAALADFNADGKLDLLFTTYTGTQMRFGNGDGTFGAPVAFTVKPVPNYPFGLYVGLAATADVDRDGNLDVAFGSTVYLGNGDGTFRSSARFRTFLSSVTFADMDENGSPDLVLHNTSANDVAILTTYTTSDPTESSSVTLSASLDNPRFNQNVIFTARVDGSEIPVTGGVAFTIDGKPFGIAAVDLAGEASINTAFTVGPHDVVATYVGDENYLSSLANRQVDVAKALTTLQVGGMVNPQQIGRSVEVRVTLSSDTSGGLAAETARITLRDGDMPLDVPIVNGRAIVTTLDIGTHVIHADYPGSESYEPSTASYTQTITKPVPNLFLSKNPSTPLAGMPVTLHAYFSTGQTTTGTISFYDGGTLLGAVPLSQSTADLQFTPSAGAHTISVRYSGDDTWEPTERDFSLYALLEWGSPSGVNASGYSSGIYVSWPLVNGAASYTLWRRTSLANGWEIAKSVSGSISGTWITAIQNTSALVAVTATDAGGNVSPMSAPDLATTFSPQDPSLSIIKARHFLDLRTMIQCVRTFAGLPPFAYTNAIQAGEPVRAIDMRELRTALFEARSAIGLPTNAFTDNVLTPNVSPIRSAHILELRAGAN